MADERKCYAGDLGTGQIGKVIHVRVKVGKEGAIVSDRLKAVRHAVVGKELRTTVVFENLNPTVVLIGSTPDGYQVDPEATVTVLP